MAAASSDCEKSPLEKGVAFPLPEPVTITGLPTFAEMSEQGVGAFLSE